MDVKFIAVPSDSLDLVPVKNGQIISLIDVPGYYYDMSSERRQITASINSTTLPTSGQNNVVYVATEGDEFHGPGSYLWDSTNQVWIPIGVNRIKGAAEDEFRSGDVIITKEDIGLGNVENRSQSQIMGAMTSADIAAALGYTPVAAESKGKPNGIPSLDDGGKIPNSQLPASFESIVAAETFDDLSKVGEIGALYETTDNHNFYIWDGDKYTGLTSTSLNKKYVDLWAEGTSTNFYNKYAIEVDPIDRTSPMIITYKATGVCSADPRIRSTIIATVNIGSDIHDVTILNAVAFQPSDQPAALLGIAVAETNKAGFAYRAPYMLGVHLESTAIEIDVDFGIISIVNAKATLRDEVIRHGDLESDLYSASPVVMMTPTTGCYAVSNAEVAEDSVSLITGADLYRIFGGTEQTAAKTSFVPTGKISADNVQDAILQAAASGGSGSGLEMIPWSAWKNLTDNQRDEYDIVAVEDTPVAPYSVGQAYIDVGRTITKAEFDKLSPTQQNTGTWYISDAGMLANEITSISVTLTFDSAGNADINHYLITPDSRIFLQPTGASGLGKTLSVTYQASDIATVAGYDLINSTELIETSIEAIVMIDNR